MKPREGLAKGNTYLQDYVDAKLEAVSEKFKQMPYIIVQVSAYLPKQATLQTMFFQRYKVGELDLGIVCIPLYGLSRSIKSLKEIGRNTYHL